VQNLVFYGVSQNTGTNFFSRLVCYNHFILLGSWDLNPYLSFTISAVVELAAYIVVHLILDRIGRKIPYFVFAILFGVVALLILPVQNYVTKGSSAQLILMNIINGALKFLASASYAIIYIYANELFPTNVRNTGMGICSMIARIGAIIGTFCNDYLVSFEKLERER
jgi:OCT family organic cation transporter-like MFS transporter 4/5